MNSKITITFNSLPAVGTELQLLDSAFPLVDMRAIFADIPSQPFEVSRSTSAFNAAAYYYFYLRNQFPNASYTYSITNGIAVVTIESTDPTTVFSVVTNTTGGAVTTQIDNSTGTPSSLSGGVRTLIDDVSQITFCGSPIHLRLQNAAQDATIQSAFVYLWVWNGNQDKALGAPNRVLFKKKVSSSDTYINFEIADYIRAFLESPDNAPNTNQPQFGFNLFSEAAITGQGVFWQIVTDITSTAGTVRNNYETNFATLGYRWNYEQNALGNNGVAPNGSTGFLGQLRQTTPVSVTYTPVSRVIAGDAFTADDGEINWEGNNFAGGQAGTNYTVNVGVNINASISSRDASVPSYITTPVFNAIFAKERYDLGSSPEMIYDFPVTNGDFIVRIYLGNSFSGTSTAGTRVFSIDINGVTAHSNIDLINEFGHQVGGMLEYSLNVTTSNIEVEFLHGSADNPIVSAIEILKASDTIAPDAPDAPASLTVNKWYSPKFSQYFSQSFKLDNTIAAATTANMITRTPVTPDASWTRCALDAALIVYINKLGLWDIFTPHGKITASSSIEGQEQNKGYRDPSRVDNTYQHSKLRAGLDVSQSWQINTGSLTEDMINDVEQILYSPKVYLIKFNGQIQKATTIGITIDSTLVTIDDTNITIDSVSILEEFVGDYKAYEQIPVIVKDSDFTRKNRVNDKNAIDYNIKFEETNNKILDIR